MDELESRLAAIETRLARLERLAGQVPYYSETVKERMAGPPPPPPPRPSMGVPPYVLPPTATPPRARTQATAEETEYQIGARVLPVVGAVAILAAIAYLVSLGLQRGWITPPILFGSVCFGCLAFIGVGLWKRNEREEFGQILTGIGSCGLYLNFAAGHVYQHLYEGETLVGLFMGLSLLNLVFAAWRSSKPFLAIGVLGGLSAALMPLHDKKPMLDVVLHLLILAPALTIVAWNRWSRIATVVYIVGTLALMPAMLMAGGVSIYAVAAGLLGTALISVAAYSWAGIDPEQDPRGLFAPVALVTSSVLALAIRSDPTMGAVVLGGAVLAALLGWAFLHLRNGREVLIGAALCAFVNAPYGLSLEQSAWTYLALGVLAVLVGKYRLPKAGAWFCGLELIAATWCYLQLSVHDTYPVGRESAMLVGLIALALASAHVLYKAYGQLERFSVAALVFTGPILARLVFQGAFLPEDTRRGAYALVGGLVLYAAIACAVSVGTRWRSALVVGWIGASIAAFVYVDSIAAGISSVTAAGLVMEVSLAAIAVGLLRASRFQVADRDLNTLGAFSTFLVAALASRFLYLGIHSLGVGFPAAPLIAATLAAIGAAGVARWTKLGGVPWGATMFFATANLNYYLAILGSLSLGRYDAWLAIGQLLTLAICCSAVQRQGEEQVLYWGAALAAWPLASHLGWLTLGPRGLGMNDNAAITASWIALALVLLSTGFVKDKMHLRLSSFMVVAATIVKVVMVDLANTDQAIKALILIFLGLVTLGGGYWYIRVKGQGMAPR